MLNDVIKNIFTTSLRRSLGARRKCRTPARLDAADRASCPVGKSSNLRAVLEDNFLFAYGKVDGW